MSASFRPCADYYVGGQDEQVCDDCGRDQYTCDCEEEVCCTSCGDLVKAGADCGWCATALVHVERLSPSEVVL